MKICVSRTAVFGCLSLFLATGMLSAQSEDIYVGAEAEHAHTRSEGVGKPEIVPHRANPHENALTAGSTGQITPIITDHGGSIITGTVDLYLIWYGNWNQSNGSDTASGQQLVRTFVSDLSGSHYYQTNTSYAASGLLAVSGEYTDSYSHGTRLSDSAVQAVVTSAISGGHLKSDTNGVYLVLTSSDVSERSGFCSQYCGWHTYYSTSGSSIKYAFIGNAYRCLSACAAQTVGPNGNAGVDGMLSVIAHEVEETNTDPNLNAWYDSSGAEDADKCAWTFGANQQKAPNGAYYNMTMNGRNYLIQRELDSSSKCYVDYVTKAQ